MTFEILDHDGSTVNLVLKDGSILDVACGWDPVDSKNEFNPFYALKMLQRLSSDSSKGAK